MQCIKPPRRDLVKQVRGLHLFARHSHNFACSCVMRIVDCGSERDKGGGRKRNGMAQWRGNGHYSGLTLSAALGPDSCDPFSGRSSSTTRDAGNLKAEAETSIVRGAGGEER